MQNISISICLCLLPLIISAQSLERSVIASAGDETGSGELSLSYTIGEAVIETLQHPTLQLTQGFQQSKWVLVNSGDAIVQLQAKVYPNPAVSEVHLQFQSDRISDWNLQVFDQKGQIMHKDQFQFIGEQQIVIDCSAWPSGMYYLHLREKKGGVRTVKVEKVE